MYNLKNQPTLIFLTGVVSYLYLFSSLLNNKYNIIFIYFTILFIGYFIVGKKIFLYNLLIIIFDILNKTLILKEGNDYDTSSKIAKENATNSTFNKDTKIDAGIDEDESDKLQRNGGKAVADKI